MRFKYSEKVHQVDGEDGPYLRDTEGNLYNPKIVRPVPPGSASIEVPQELQAVGLEERTFSRERMWPFARQIHAWLKEQDEPTAYIKINEEFRSPAMKQALEDAKLGWLRQKDVTNKPAAILKLFPRWFREEGKQKFIAIGGDMPAAFKPEPDDPDDEEYMQEAREKKPGPGLRLRGKQKPPSLEQDLERYLSILETWLAAKPKRSASAADVMRFLRGIAGFSSFAKRYPTYASTNRDRFEALPGRTGNPTIRAKNAPAPTAESGPVAEPGSAPKGPERSRAPLGPLAKALLRPRAAGASSRGSRPTAR